MTPARVSLLASGLILLGLGAAWLVRRGRLAGYEGWHTVSTEGR
jgi:hypothetical protein